MSAAATVPSREVAPNLSATHWLLSVWIGNDLADAGLAASSDANRQIDATTTTVRQTDRRRRLWDSTMCAPVALIRVTGPPPAQQDHSVPREQGCAPPVSNRQRAA